MFYKKKFIVRFLVVLCFLFFFGNIALADNTIVRPDGDGATINWTTSGVTDNSCAGGTHCDFIDDNSTQPGGAGDGRYIYSSTDSVVEISVVNTFSMSGGSVSAVNVWLYAYSANNTRKVIDVTLRWGGADQATIRVTPPSAAWGWVNANFTGLNLTQTQLDGLEVKLTGIRLSGPQNSTEARVEVLYGAVTWTSPPILTVSTNGSQTLYADSSDGNVYLGGSFTFSINTATASITAVTVSNNGTAGNLSDVRLYYDTDGTWSGSFTESCFNSGGCSDGAGSNLGTSINGTMNLASGSTYYMYVLTDIDGAIYGGQTADIRISNPSTDITTDATNTDTNPKDITGLLTVKPKITSYANSTESALDWVASCANCGARMGSGVFSQTVVISGYGFGSDPGSGSRDTAANKVEIVGASTTIFTDNIGDSNVTSWSNTSISVTTNTAITGNSDTDWGTNFGDGAALRVTAGSQAVAIDREFYIFPQITALTTPDITDAAREYGAGDTAGVITLNGTRFGSSQGTGWVRILGCDSSTCSSPTGSATVSLWTNTAIEVQVPIVIDDNTYTGSIDMLQGTGTNSKQHAYAGFRILPRILSVDPASADIGNLFTLFGNHFCQSGGLCPIGFDANNAVIFTASQSASVFVSWASVSAQTIIPSGAVSGDVFIVSDTYFSNGKNFNLSVGARVMHFRWRNDDGGE